MNFLAFDIGGTFLKYGLIDEQGVVLEKWKEPNALTDESSFLQFLNKIIAKERHQIVGIGISFPGVIDVDRQVVVSSATFPFLEGSNFVDALSQQYQLPVVIENDGNCAALAEQRFGNLKGIANGALLVLGTGVGGALFLGQNLLHGTHFVAAEPSFMVLNESQDDGRQTAAYLSVPLMLNKIARYLGMDSQADGEAVFQQIIQEEPFAKREFTSFCHAVATIIFNMQTLLDLERVVIGGGISQQPLLIKKLSEELLAYQQAAPLTQKTVKLPELVAASFYNDANLIGSVVPLLK